MWFGRLGSLTSLMLTHCRQNVDALSFDKLVIAVLMPVSSLTVEVVLQRQVVDAQKFGLPWFPSLRESASDERHFVEETSQVGHIPQQT